MSSSLYTPFSFNKSSTQIRTSSYTIPVGKYANVVFKCFTQSNGTIGTITLNGVIVLRSSDSYSYNGVNQQGSANSLRMQDTQPPEEVELWLKSGDVINGSGSWRAIVTEFNVRQ